MIDPSEITLDVIEEWAKANDPEEVAGQSGKPLYCPVKRCIKELLESDEMVIVRGDSFSVGFDEFDTPADVTALVQAIEDTHLTGTPVTFEEILELIAGVREGEGEEEWGCRLGMALREILSGARMVGEDRNHGYVMAWFGGHGIHAYSLDGEEVAFWNVGDFERMEADKAEVEKNMKGQIVSGEYMDYMER